MSNAFVISDTHFGHENAIRFREGFESIEQHDEYLIDRWNSKVGKRDIVYHLGDFSFKSTQEYVDAIRDRLNGRIKLVTGNHDHIIPKDVEVMPGLYTKFGYWMSHAPIHPLQLRNRFNIHGHVHLATIPDTRYFNVSAECLEYLPISIDILRMMLNQELARS